MSKELFEQIKANRAKLDACPRHRFGELPPHPWKINQKIACRRCGGELGMIEAAQYARGFEAAGGNPDEVISNFRGDDESPVTCPVCNGVCGVNVADGMEEQPDGSFIPNEDWHDCDFCDATGLVERAKALSHLDEKQDEYDAYADLCQYFGLKDNDADIARNAWLGALHFAETGALSYATNNQPGLFDDESR